MFNTIIFYFLVLVAAAGSFYLLAKATRCKTPFPTLGWMVSMLVIWSIISIPMTDTNMNSRILEGCGNEQVRAGIDRHIEITNKIHNRYHAMEKIADFVNEYEAIEERLENCTRAFEYFHESDHYRYSWLNSLADFTKYTLTDPEILVREHRTAIHTIRVYLRDSDA